jgi:hypothetical protein
MISKEQFEAEYAGRSGVTVEYLYHHGRRAVRCKQCDSPDCQGWAMAHVESFDFEEPDD